MTDDQEKLLKATSANVQAIHDELVGNPEFKRPGLINRVGKLEDWKVQIDSKMARYAGIIVGAGLISEGLKWILTRQ